MAKCLANSSLSDCSSFNHPVNTQWRLVIGVFSIAGCAFSLFLRTSKMFPERQLRHGIAGFLSVMFFCGCSQETPSYPLDKELARSSVQKAMQSWVDGTVTRQKGAYGLISVDVGTCQSTYSFLGFATIWYSKSGGVCTNTETARTTKKTAVFSNETLDLTMVAPAGLCFRMQYKNDSGSTSYARLNY